MKHRREIDVPLAIAVVPVILFHAGFVSIDVFFIISRYFAVNHDFTTCNELYCADRTHYSKAGKNRFGDRVTLLSVLGHE